MSKKLCQECVIRATSAGKVTEKLKYGHTETQMLSKARPFLFVEIRLRPDCECRGKGRQLRALGPFTKKLVLCLETQTEMMNIKYLASTADIRNVKR